MRTAEGFPVKIDRVWWRARYGATFPDFLKEEKNEILDGIIDDVYSMWYGVNELWERLDRKVYEDKTQMCYGLLVAWYITDLYPESAIGVMTTGGIPIQSKSIGGVKISFGALQQGRGLNADLLSSLKSNPFGAKAYTMIKTSGKVNLFLQR